MLNQRMTQLLHAPDKWVQAVAPKGASSGGGLSSSSSLAKPGLCAAAAGPQHDGASYCSSSSGALTAAAPAAATATSGAPPPVVSLRHMYDVVTRKLAAGRLGGALDNDVRDVCRAIGEQMLGVCGSSACCVRASLPLDTHKHKNNAKKNKKTRWRVARGARHRPLARARAHV